MPEPDAGRRPQIVFCDANILFSAALGGEAFGLLLELGHRGRVHLTTSPYCRLEARTNLERKRPDALARLERMEPLFADAPVGREHLATAGELVAAKDAAVLASALAGGSDVLLTGDTTHFGHLMSRTDLPLRVRTLRAFLLEE